MGSWHHNCIREKISELNVKGAYDIRPEIQQKIIQNGLYAYQNIEELLNTIKNKIYAPADASPILKNSKAFL